MYDTCHRQIHRLRGLARTGEPPPAWTKRPNAKDDLRERARELRLQGWTAIGDLSPRELFLAGVVLYWAEGSKDKMHGRQRRENLQFINSDPNVVRFYLRWLESLGVERERLRFRVYIHESADVAAAENFWAELVGPDAATFQRTPLKRHNPRTVRKNVGDSYRGCLAIYVTRSAELYRRMEGAWYGIVGADSAADLPNRT
ncbi:hypothetical protein [Streptomyces sp. NPDC015242]|uniref:hypothetical protein n=1 Tax=Streptomyces sp. NPDC015242 TaxID=3364951 RepID=UPI0036FBA7D8